MNRNVLKSWKEIAGYLSVSVRTAQRWKQERGLPVRQPGTQRRSAVLAITAELDRWLLQSSEGNSKTPLEEVELSDVNATNMLWSRHSRPPRYPAEIRLLLAMYRKWAQADSLSLLEELSSFAMQQCKAESAGFSIRETDERGAQIFRWTATRGRMEEFVGGTTPANFSPCAVCLARDSPQLFVYPEKLYTYLDAVSPIGELLLVPMHEIHSPIGTIWVISHENFRRFDLEDVRVLTDLASIAAAALATQVGSRSS
jgi:hypothetical protein